MFYHFKKVLGYTSIIALLNSSFFPLYAGQRKHNPHLEDSEVGSKQHRLPQQDAKTEEKPSRPIGLVLEDYLTENLQKVTPDFVKESYNDFCDWLGNSWFAQTAKEVGATADAKTLFEIDYKNPRYWQFHFTDVLEDLKTLKPAKAKERLIELQTIVWHGLLSPFTYEREMDTLKSLKPSMKQIQKDFRSKLKENRDFLKASFARDSLRFLENFGQQKEGIKGSVKGLNSLLNYYVQIQNSLDYEESLDDLWHFVLRNRSPLSLTQETYEPLNDALFKAMMNAANNRNQKEYEALKAECKTQIQKNWETRLAFLEELPAYDEDSTFNSALPAKEKEKSVSFTEHATKGLKKLARFAKEGLRYASENPGKVIVTGLLAKATAAAAWNVFKVPEKKIHPYEKLAERQTSEKQFNGDKTSPQDQTSQSLFRRQANGTVGNEFQISKNSTSNQFTPAVTGLNNGNSFVVWQGDQTGNNDISGNIFSPNGTALNNQFIINNQTTNFTQNSPTIKRLTNGNAFVAWAYQTGISGGVHGRVFSTNGTALNNEFNINQNTTGLPGFPSVANLTNGNVFVTWVNQTGNLDIYGRVLFPNGTALNNEFGINQNTTAGIPASPSTAGLINGNVFVAWTGQKNGIPGAHGRVFFPNGTALTNEFGINQNTTGGQYNPTVAGLNNGNAFVVWQGDQTGNFEIYGRLFFPNGTALSNDFTINQVTTDRQINPSVTVLNNDDAFVVWEDSQNYNIYGRIFSSNGIPLSNEFVVNQNTTYNGLPSVTGLNNGDVFVTWQGTESIESTLGIYGRIFTNDTLASFLYTPVPTPGPTPAPSRVSPSTTEPLSTNNQPSSNSTAIGLGVGIPLTLGLIGAGAGSYACLKKGYCDPYLPTKIKRSRFYPRQNIEMGISDSRLKSDTEIQWGYTTIPDQLFNDGRNFRLFTDINQPLANFVRGKTGLEIQFNLGEKRKKDYVIGEGQFGSIGLAHYVKKNEINKIVAVKTVTNEKPGVDAIEKAKQEAKLQSEIKSEHIMPVHGYHNFIPKPNSPFQLWTEPTLLIFMNLSVFGNGEFLQKKLSLWNDPIKKEKVMKYVAKGLLTGLYDLHRHQIAHLDIHKKNLMMGRNTLSHVDVIDLGCAVKVSNIEDYSGEELGHIDSFDPGRWAFRRYEHKKLGENIESEEMRSSFSPAASDAFATGLTLFEIYTNKKPFEHADYKRKILKWTSSHYTTMLGKVTELQNVSQGSMLGLMKQLLEVDAQKRIRPDKALQWEGFQKVISDQEADYLFQELRELKERTVASTAPSQPPSSSEKDEYFGENAQGKANHEYANVPRTENPNYQSVKQSIDHYKTNDSKLE